MKVTIDTNDLFHDDQMSPDDILRELVIKKIADRYEFKSNTTIDNGIMQMKDQISDRVMAKIDTKAEALLTPIFETILDQPYQEKDNWGRKTKQWTIRDRINKAIEEQCKFKDSPYSRESNPFSKAIIEAATSKCKEFEQQWYKAVDKKFIDQALEHATKQFKKRMEG